MTTPICALPPNNEGTATFASALQVSVVPDVMLGLAGYNSKASTQFIQIHDAISAPAEGSAPAFNLIVGASSNFSVDFGVYGMNFLNGIYVCNSTTAPTKTLGLADCQFFARVAQP
jgi:hypothetical protein